MYVEFKESTQRISTKNIYKEFPQYNSRKLFDKVQISVFKMILMNKWFSEFLTLQTKYFNDLIFDDFIDFSQNNSRKLFDKVQNSVFTLCTKYLYKLFRQSSKNTKLFTQTFLQSKYSKVY